MGGGVAKANLLCNPIIFVSNEPIQKFRLMGQPIHSAVIPLLLKIRGTNVKPVLNLPKSQLS
jgi:hypothetical protein